MNLFTQKVQSPTAQVTESKKAPIAEPFAVSSQYKKKLLAQIAEKENSQPERPAKKTKVPPVAASSSTDEVYKPAEYSEKRKAYIRKLQEEGLAFREASDQWNKSSERAKLLSALSVSELVRRRFLPKGSQSNPWAS